MCILCWMDKKYKLSKKYLCTRHVYMNLYFSQLLVKAMQLSRHKICVFNNKLYIRDTFKAFIGNQSFLTNGIIQLHNHTNLNLLLSSLSHGMGLYCLQSFTLYAVHKDMQKFSFLDHLYQMEAIIVKKDIQNTIYCHVLSYKGNMIV